MPEQQLKLPIRAGFADPLPSRRLRAAAGAAARGRRERPSRASRVRERLR